MNTMNESNTNAPRRYALISGISLVLMAVVAGFSYGYVHSSLINMEDAQTTYQNLTGAKGLFTAGILGWIIIFLLDAIVAWALYLFFASTSKALAFTSSFLRIAYTAVLGIAIYNLPKALQLINGQLPSTDLEDAASLVTQYLTAFNSIWSNGLIIFGLHLMVLGYLAFKAEFVPKIWGWLLMLAGVSYVFVSSMHALSPELAESMNTIEMVLSIPMTIGELGFAIWLIIKGGRTKSQ